MVVEDIIAPVVDLVLTLAVVTVNFVTVADTRLSFAGRSEPLIRLKDQALLSWAITPLAWTLILFLHCSH